MQTDCEASAFKTGFSLPPFCSGAGASHPGWLTMKVKDLLERILRSLADVKTQNEMIIRQNVELLLAFTALAEERKKESE